MSLSEWLANGWLKKHRTSPQEIANLLTAADQDLANGVVPGLSDDWKHTIAYHAALKCASAALAACGCRAPKGEEHYRLVHSLPLTLGPTFENVAERLETARSKRHLAVYERSGAISEGEAEEVLELANRLRQDVERWLQENHPELLPSARHGKDA